MYYYRVIVIVLKNALSLKVDLLPSKKHIKQNILYLIFLNF
ncbi:MAG: hypothetical protein AVDCRST_MAG96-1774 [uncultured Segetibacter sp.]|uniref:Uncharacterized protein n=1 Tax=uncultured Segetibacter sp. TaxID=481133 RepID=A0A6J4SN52_9BACT|nr:MAG: hypothetical protein AVDCRST_MAG96-1774 [uncultured Segetibacter sp.]